MNKEDLKHCREDRWQVQESLAVRSPGGGRNNRSGFLCAGEKCGPGYGLVHQVGVGGSLNEREGPAKLFITPGLFRCYCLLF